MAATSKILILTDDYGFFSSSKMNKTYNMDTELIANLLTEKGYTTQIAKFNNINWSDDFQESLVLYPSSEAPGLFYKSYIEDILLRLQYKGARLLPDFKYFRAHHNKVFMEYLRRDMKSEELKSVHSMCFGSIKAVQEKVDELIFPLIIKPSFGSGSVGVIKVDNIKQLMKAVKKISPISVRSFRYSLYNLNPFMQKLKNSYRKMTGMKPARYPVLTDKFILQQFINNLEGDYKVLIFGEKYYVLFRQNRPDNITASGSGLFSFPTLSDDLIKVLDFAKIANEEVNTPILSLDIGYDGSTCHLIEFQCINLGTYTLEFSEGYFKKTDSWTYTEGKSVLEKEYVNSLIYWLDNDELRKNRHASL